MGYQYLADDKGNPRQDGIQRTGDPGTTIPSWVPNDPASSDWRAFQTWLAQGNTPTAAAWSPSPRTAALSSLLDSLSPVQRASITPDHMARLQAELADHPGGLPVTNNKVARAAGDLGMSPEAWFTLSGS